jgi:hypothetical protein
MLVLWVAIVFQVSQRNQSTSTININNQPTSTINNLIPSNPLELGIYSGFVSRSNDILFSKHLGSLLRTKAANQNEAGVAAGFGALDAPYLL